MGGNPVKFDGLSKYKLSVKTGRVILWAGKLRGEGQ